MSVDPRYGKHLMTDRIPFFYAHDFATESFLKIYSSWFQRMEKIPWAMSIIIIRQPKYE